MAVSPVCRLFSFKETWLWSYACWWWPRIWELNYNQCFHYPMLFPLTPDPIVEAGGPSVYESWLMRAQRHCKWETESGSVMTAPGQVLTPSPGPGTVHLETSNIIISHTFHTLCTWVSLLKLWNTGWKGHEAEEQHQDSHGLLEAPVRGRLGFSARPWLLWIWRGSWECKSNHRRLPFALQVTDFCFLLIGRNRNGYSGKFSGSGWVSNPWQTRNILNHTMQIYQAKDENVYHESIFNQWWYNKVSLTWCIWMSLKFHDVDLEWNLGL